MKIEDEAGVSLNMVRFRLWRGEASALIHDAREAVETLLEDTADDDVLTQDGYTVTLEIRADGRLGAFVDIANPS